MGSDTAVSTPSPEPRERRKSMIDDHQKRVGLSYREEKLDPPVSIRDRKCTDILFLLIFILYWVGIVTIGIVGQQNGDPRLLIYGSDSNKVTCGGDQKPNETFVVFPRAAEDAFIASQSFTSKTDLISKLNFYSVCVNECPQEGDIVCSDEGKAALEEETDGSQAAMDNKALICIYDKYTNIVCPTSNDNNKIIKNNCFLTLFDTSPVLFRCLPKYEYSVEIVESESGCQEYRNVTLESVTSEVCVKYKEVKKITTVEPTATDLFFDTFNTASRMFQRYLGDIYKAQTTIMLAGIGVATMGGLAYIISLFCCVGVVVWTSVVMTQVMALLFTLYCYLKAGYIPSDLLNNVTSSVSQFVSTTTSQISSKTGIDLLSAPSNLTATISSFTNGSAIPGQFQLSASNQYQFEVAAYCMTALTVLIFFLVVSMASRISRAIEIFKEASRAIRANPTLISLPAFSLLFITTTLLMWGWSTAYIASAGSYSLLSENGTQLSPTFEADAGVVTLNVFGELSYKNILIIYLFFGMLWTINVLNGIVVMITAGSVGAWYWAGAPADDEEGTDKKRTDYLSKWPTFRAIYITFRFHLGSICFGSLLVAIVQLMRYAAAYLESKTKDLQRKNTLVRAVMCCVHCFLKCLETCVKFISRNAFIQAAMYGEGFCMSTKSAFVTLTSNLAQVATITFLGDLIMRFGQISLTLTSGLLAWLYLDSRPEYHQGGSLELNTFWFPSMLAMFLCWFASHEVLSIYDIAVDTILLQFCQDKRLSKQKKHHKVAASKRFTHFVEDNDARGPSRRQSIQKAFGGADKKGASIASS